MIYWFLRSGLLLFKANDVRDTAIMSCWWWGNRQFESLHYSWQSLQCSDNVPRLCNCLFLGAKLKIVWEMITLRWLKYSAVVFGDLVHDTSGIFAFVCSENLNTINFKIWGYSLNCHKTSVRVKLLLTSNNQVTQWSWVLSQQIRVARLVKNSTPYMEQKC